MNLIIGIVVEELVLNKPSAEDVKVGVLCPVVDKNLNSIL